MLFTRMALRRRRYRKGHKKLLRRTECEPADISWTSSSDDDLHFKDDYKTIKSTENEAHSVIEPPAVIDFESPVIGKTAEQESSPLLSQTGNISASASPVIGNYTAIKRARRNICDNNLRIEQTSPDIFLTQALTVSNPIICEVQSPPTTPVKISPVKTQDCRPIQDTQLFISGEPTPKVPLSVINSTDTSASSGNTVKFSDSTPLSKSCDSSFTKKKRRRCKKNGLASNLQKCIKNKEANVALWLHEQYLNRLEDVPSESHLLKIEDLWNECGNTVLYCRFISEFPEESDSMVERTWCFVLINNEIISYFCPKKGVLFYLYEPYKIKHVEYDSKLLKCFCNVWKVRVFESDEIKVNQSR